MTSFIALENQTFWVPPPVVCKETPCDAKPLQERMKQPVQSSTAAASQPVSIVASKERNLSLPSHAMALDEVISNSSDAGSDTDVDEVAYESDNSLPSVSAIAAYVARRQAGAGSTGMLRRQ